MSQVKCMVGKQDVTLLKFNKGKIQPIFTIQLNFIKLN